MLNAQLFDWDDPTMSTGGAVSGVTFRETITAQEVLVVACYTALTPKE